MVLSTVSDKFKVKLIHHNDFEDSQGLVQNAQKLCALETEASILV